MCLSKANPDINILAVDTPPPPTPSPCPPHTHTTHSWVWVHISGELNVAPPPSSQLLGLRPQRLKAFLTWISMSSLKGRWLQFSSERSLANRYSSSFQPDPTLNQETPQPSLSPLHFLLPPSRFLLLLFFFPPPASLLSADVYEKRKKKIIQHSRQGETKSSGKMTCRIKANVHIFILENTLALTHIRTNTQQQQNSFPLCLLMDGRCVAAGESRGQRCRRQTQQ